MKLKDKRPSWRPYALLLIPAVALSIIIAHTEWAAVVGNLFLAEMPTGLIHTTLARVHGIGDGSAVTGIVSVWITSPLVAGAGYLFVSRIISDHIIWVTPQRKRTALFRGMAALLLAAVGIACVLLLPGKDSSRCPGCEQALVPLILLGHLQTHAIGSVLGYVACMWSILKKKTEAIDPAANAD